MDWSMQLRHLEQAEDRISRGARHVFDQETRIADLDRRGYDTSALSWKPFRAHRPSKSRTAIASFGS
jgi:hypothetical protein